MQYIFAPLLAFAGLALASPSPAGVGGNPSPSGSAPPGCSSSYPNSFYISTVKPSGSKMVKRQSPNLSITLQDGILRDQDGNKGYIASNKQLQFVDGSDPNPQAGTLYSAGFSICANNTIALGDTTIFQSCNSGSFDNLYYGNDAAQCENVNLNALDSGSSAGSSPVMSSAMSSASPTASSASSSAAPSSAAPSYGGAASPTPMTPSASLAPTGTSAPTSYTGAAAATAAPMAMAAAGAFLALL